MIIALQIGHEQKLVLATHSMGFSDHVYLLRQPYVYNLYIKINSTVAIFLLCRRYNTIELRKNGRKCCYVFAREVGQLGYTRSFSLWISRSAGLPAVQ